MLSISGNKKHFTNFSFFFFYSSSDIKNGRPLHHGYIIPMKVKINSVLNK